jgi:hypothetical protein
MPLPSSGSQISLNQIHVEAGGSSGSQAALNDADIRAMIGKSSGASNAFSEYYGITNSAPTATYIGRLLTTGNGFPNGALTFNSGTKVVVVTLQLAGPSNTFVNFGSTAMTQACKIDNAASGGVWAAAPTSAVYWLQTSTSGSVSISGNGGSGRSVLHAWEITGYNSATPHSTATAQNTNTSSFSKTISLSTKYNGCTIGSGVTEDTNPVGSVTVSNSDSLQQIDLESATNHYSWRDQGTAEGTTNYNCNQNNPASNIVSGSTIQQLAAAHWK